MENDILVTPYYNEPLIFTDKLGNKHYGEYVRSNVNDDKGNYRDSYTGIESAIVQSWEYI